MCSLLQVGKTAGLSALLVRSLHSAKPCHNAHWSNKAASHEGILKFRIVGRSSCYSVLSRSMFISCVWSTRYRHTSSFFVSACRRITEFSQLCPYRRGSWWDQVSPKSVFARAKLCWGTRTNLRFRHIVFNQKHFEIVYIFLCYGVSMGGNRKSIPSCCAVQQTSRLTAPYNPISMFV